MKSPRALRRGLVTAALALTTGLATIAAAGPPGQPPMDPRQMSGIPRVDPAVAVGTITVRCLLGAFDRPAVGVEVRLALRSSDGAKTEVAIATTDGEGRATFADLGGYVGGTAIASAELSGQTLRSQAIPIAASAGSRVMLVQGAEASARPEAPMPGRAFADERFPRGTVVVGALDMSARSGIAGTEIRLEIRPPEGEVIERTARTDREGRAVFDGLVAPIVPDGSTLTIEARLDPDPAAPPQRSEPFTLGEVGMALVFTIGASSQDPAAIAPTQRRPVMPPRATPTVAPGGVRVAVIDGADRPVGDLAVTIKQRSFTGASSSYEGKTGADGVALVDGIEVSSEAAYSVEVLYKGAPYRSSLFTMTDALGVAAELRVFPTTRDATRLRSAAQLEIIGRENDLAQVTQLYQVFVDGDEAYWPAAPLELAGAEGAIGFVVMDRATASFDHDEKSPVAILSEPIPPGEIVDMSFAYLVEHDGAAAIRWTPPLSLIEVGVILPQTQTLTRGAKGRPTPPPNAPDAAFDYYGLGSLDAGVPLDLEISGLPVRPHLYRDLGWIFGLGMIGGLGLAIAFAGRRSPRERLDARKAELLGELDRVDAATRAGDGAAAGERRRIIAELDHVFHLLGALGPRSDRA